MAIAKLMFKVFIFLHFLSISLNSFAMIEKKYQIHPTWRDSIQLTTYSNIDAYIIGWYWGATILSTVGFG
jgi:hypothetical protein